MRWWCEHLPVGDGVSGGFQTAGGRVHHDLPWCQGRRGRGGSGEDPAGCDGEHPLVCDVPAGDAGCCGGDGDRAEEDRHGGGGGLPSTGCPGNDLHIRVRARGTQVVDAGDHNVGAGGPGRVRGHAQGALRGETEQVHPVTLCGVRDRAVPGVDEDTHTGGGEGSDRERISGAREDTTAGVNRRRGHVRVPDRGTATKLTLKQRRPLLSVRPETRAEVDGRGHWSPRRYR